MYLRRIYGFGAFLGTIVWLFSIILPFSINPIIIQMKLPQIIIFNFLGVITFAWIASTLGAKLFAGFNLGTIANKASTIIFICLIYLSVVFRLTMENGDFPLGELHLTLNIITFVTINLLADIGDWLAYKIRNTPPLSQYSAATDFPS